MTHLRQFVLLTLVACLFAASTNAQKLAKKYFEDEQYGYRFKPLEDSVAVPPQPREAEIGIVCKMAGKDLTVRKDGQSISISIETVVLRFEERTERGEEGEEAEKDRSVSESKVRDDLGLYLESHYKGVDQDKPTLDEEKRVKKLLARHRMWKATTPQYGIPLMIDTWTFPLEDADVHLIYIIPEDHAKKWGKSPAKSAKTFAEIKRKTSGAELVKGASYEDVLAYHKEKEEKLEGWTATATPSKKFIIVSNSDNKKFIKNVIERLEKSRGVYEKDFPPPADFDAVSIVRVCATEEEFHKYGGTGGGTAGWFSPSSTELVLYNSKNVDPNMTYAVMSHEAFHQYCHFLFDQSEAHRWFDEGHGDYYGAAEFTGSKVKIKRKMPAGLNRYDIIKGMVKDGTYTPIEEHINYSHGEWQSKSLDSYSQSWSIIYMLRQGAVKKVPKKYWKKEFANIIPNYVTTLNDGFQEAYSEIRAEREAKAKEQGRELEDEEKDINRFNLTPGQKDAIWEEALAASWGQVDIAEFEELWVAYVKDSL